MKAILALEDGTVYEGSAIGATGTATGELCFNTAVAGYQELITDPATRGLIPVMTYPLIGNYGICTEDNESTRPQANALVVTELARLHCNWRANTDMGSWMQQFNMVGIEGVDCRAIATHLRENGSMRACVSTELSADAAVAAAQAAPTLAGTDPLSYVCTDDAAAIQGRDLRGWKLPNKTVGDMTNYTELPAVIGKIAVLNFGIKFSTIATLRQHGYECDILPATTAADAILSGKEYKAVFLSDGAGDPAALSPEVLANIKAIAGSGMPVFGTGMGHLALAKAFGAATRQLPFGHHGANQPVKDERIGHVLITSQNESFTVVAESLPAELEVIQTNMNDNTVAALRHKELPIFTVQYQPADIAGPKGYDSYFTEITKMIQA
ncbi:MAG: glutamine-hydrolyzing carbamoyl-phosphate synthase small subunit [Akkermansiaceae bacterium]|nr:glutamine-hydrolyzing carbamoyl-phosphate synthase small subunit [Akkermansiaceae bacterium]